MKLIKIILPVAVFATGIVSAVASHSFVAWAKGINPSTFACVSGILISPPPGKTCTTGISGVRCRVDILLNGEWEPVDAFDINGNCSLTVDERLFYQP